MALGSSRRGNGYCRWIRMSGWSRNPGGLMSVWRIGWAAAKANAVPMVVLWGLAAATVAAYYLVPGVAAAFEPLMRWQVDSGWVAAFLNRFPHQR